jgi:peptidoglycan/LPS O-acetylase OafA/YrhL
MTSQIPPVPISSPNGKKQLPSLQILRFAAAFFVVLFHVGSGLQIQYQLTSNPFGLGAAGVDIFFVLSGFIISYTSNPARGFVDFARRRVARVVPLYWLLTLAVIIIASAKPDLLNSTVLTQRAVIRSFLFVPYEKSNGTIQPLLFLGWTLCYEMFFYLIYGLCSLVVGRRASWLASGVLLFLVGLNSLWPEGPAEWRFYTSPILAEFVLGMGLQEIFSGSDYFRSGSQLLALMSIICAPIAYFAASLFLPGIVPPAIFSALVVIGCLFWKVQKTRLIVALVLLGDASYSLYLVHPYTIQPVMKLLRKDASPALVFLLLCAATIWTIAISLALYRLVERPSQRFLLKPRPKTLLPAAEMPSGSD